MIIGIGVDIVEISRVKRAMDRHRSFIKKLFNESEIEYFRSKNFGAEFVAGHFAAKEAVSKALGTGFRGFGFKDISVKHCTSGKPCMLLSNKADAIAGKHGKYRISLSISHEIKNAIAFVVIEEVI